MDSEINLADLRTFIRGVKQVFYKNLNNFNAIERYGFIKSIVSLRIKENKVIEKSWRDMCRDVSILCKEIDDPKVFAKQIIEVLSCQKQIIMSSVTTQISGENFIQKNSLMVQKRSPISVSIVEL